MNTALRFNDNAAPMYRQIADLMRHRIARGQWEIGARLPTLEALMAEFGVARVTVRQAIELLTRDGLVSPKQGRGTFVTGQPEQRQRLKVQTTLADLAAGYRDTKAHIVTINESVSDAPVTEQDGTPAERYVFMQRVHSENGHPYCVINIYLDEAIFLRDPETFRSRPVIPLLVDMNGNGIAHARQVLTISSADMEVARYLELPVNAPVAEVRRVFTDHEGRVIYLGEVTYRGDFIHLEMDLNP